MDCGGGRLPPHRVRDGPCAERAWCRGWRGHCPPPARGVAIAGPALASRHGVEVFNAAPSVAGDGVGLGEQPALFLAGSSVRVRAVRGSHRFQLAGEGEEGGEGGHGVPKGAEGCHGCYEVMGQYCPIHKLLSQSLKMNHHFSLTD